MQAKKLGFGLMRLPVLDANDAGTIDFEKVKEMVDVFLERGFTYFDTAWIYQAGKSESAVKEILTDRYPRDKFTVTTKLPSFKIKCEEDRDKLFNTQLERTGLTYFDYYLLHDVNFHTIRRFNQYGCFEWIKEKKAEGKAKKIGFSYHDGPELLDQILTEHPEFDVVQLQINYLDWEDSIIQSRACYEVAVKHGKPVIVMEPVKGGTLANVPEEAEKMLKEKNPDMSVASWAVRFAASLDNVMMVLSGMSSMEQLLDNTGYMGELDPLTEEENQMMQEVAAIINKSIAVPCTGCAYCVDDCPMNIPIPKYFTLYNADLLEAEGKPWTTQTNTFGILSRNFGKPSACIKCGKCEEMCPQHLTIRKYLEDVAAHFE